MSDDGMAPSLRVHSCSLLECQLLSQQCLLECQLLPHQCSIEWRGTARHGRFLGMDAAVAEALLCSAHGVPGVVLVLNDGVDKGLGDLGGLADFILDLDPGNPTVSSMIWGRRASTHISTGCCTWSFCIKPG